MGKIYKFAETELQHSGASAKPKFMYIEVLPEQEGELIYNGEEQFPAWKNLDPLKLLVEGEKSAVKAGTHTITVTPMGNFAWPDDSQTPKEISYVIQRKKVTAIPTQKNSLTFNTTQQTPQWNNYNPQELKIGGTYQNQTGSGSYTATFTPDENHCWADGTFGAKNVTWTIAKAWFTKPSLSASYFDYSGSEITPAIENFNSTYMQVKSGTTKATDPGTYQIVCALNYPDDTTWSDNSTTDVTLTWHINSSQVAKVTANTSLFTFNDENQEPTWQNYDPNIMTKSGDGAKKAVGNYSTTFTLKSGYTWTGGSTDPITITWKIQRKTISAPTAKSHLEYDGFPAKPAEHVQWEGYDPSIMTITGEEQTNPGKYTATVTIINDNYMFAGGNTVTSAYWYIDKAKIPDAWKPSWTESPIVMTWSESMKGAKVWDYVNSYIQNWDDTLFKFTPAKELIEKAETIKCAITPDANHTWADGTIKEISVQFQIQEAAAPESILCQAVPYGKDASKYNYVDSNSISTINIPKNQIDAVKVYFVVPEGWTIKTTGASTYAISNTKIYGGTLPGKTVSGQPYYMALDTKNVTTSITMLASVIIERESYQTKTYEVCHFTVS